MVNIFLIQFYTPGTYHARLKSFINIFSNQITLANRSCIALY